MARQKKSAAGNRKADAPKTVQVIQSDEDVEMLEPSVDAERDAISKAEKKQRRHEENVAFWKSVSSNDSLPKTKETIEQHPVRTSRKRPEPGKISEKYELCTNASKRRMLLLQYPNRDQNQIYSKETEQKPFELRIKPKCGVVEIDIPLYTAEKYFDREKGLDFGSVLRKSQVLQYGGGYGLAGGLGIGPNKSTKSSGENSSDGPPRQRLLENFQDSSNKGYVMNKITLGGRIIPFGEGDPIFMIATFDGSKCYGQSSRLSCP